MPVEAIDDARIRDAIVGKVASITEIASGHFTVRVALAIETVGSDAGQLLNMLFGNTSLQDDVILHDIELPHDMAAAFGGPQHGLQALRKRVGAARRALTCSALKPQGLSPDRLADLARRFAEGGIDYIKDDHGLADQSYAPFAARVAAIAKALRETDASTCYIPSLSGDLDNMRTQIAAATDAGLGAVMLAPMIAGVAALQRLRRDYPQLIIMAHPAMAGAARIAPPLLIGKLFRLFGADAVVFPNHGGRFGYSPETCRALAHAALNDWHGLRAAIPVPAGGMTPARVPEMLAFYGADTMLLIGGALLSAREKLTAETAAFVAAVKDYDYD
ncbi:MAG: ribulose 1,5-bisphosphate carboxylase [Rhizobiales bacterium]|nr:ribulose 1,5-bisphosphate carboxylase [Hyphomicrobiales bacterium]